MLYSGTDPESYITEYTLVYEDQPLGGVRGFRWGRIPGCYVTLSLWRGGRRCWFRVEGLGFTAWDSRLGIQGLGFRAVGSGLRVQGFGFRV